MPFRIIHRSLQKRYFSLYSILFPKSCPLPLDILCDIASFTDDKNCFSLITASKKFSKANSFHLKSRNRKVGVVLHSLTLHCSPYRNININNIFQRAVTKDRALRRFNKFFGDYLRCYDKTIGPDGRLRLRRFYDRNVIYVFSFFYQQIF